MKPRHLLWGLVSGIAVLSISACSREEMKEQNVSDVQGYISVQLAGPAVRPSTRTVAGEDGTEAGTEVQNKISSIQLLLCNPGNGVVQFSYTLDSGNLIPITGNGVKTKPIKVQTGTFEVYVIANPGTHALSAGDDVNDYVISSITEAGMKGSYASDNTFLMFNECNGNGADDVKGSAITITEANGLENPATCNVIKLDRLAAQIRSQASADGGGDGKVTANVGSQLPSLTSATMVGFRLLNGATKTNLQQHWTKAINEQGATFAWDNVLVTPVMSYGTNAGGSEFYNALTDFRSVVKNDSEVYSEAKDLYASIPAYNGETGAIFCMENHPSTTEIARYGNTTGLIYQFKATVTGSDNLAGENSFYCYNNEYFATLAALAAKYPQALAAATGDDKVASASTELASAMTSSDVEKALSDFRVKYNIMVYKNGIMYYTWFIKDQNYIDSSITETDKSYYSVMRNTIYDFTVKSLSRIGTDIPGGWNPNVDPDDPVVNKDVYMVVEAKVNDWVLSTEDIVLE
ncbi:MAG: Mfa1 family fimbria major subunit [Bacteroidales bacterium]|jgi:hypothetical protein|nr:Mfa1 family fimbria major subunit [Bacteroidales bacterium]MCI2135368.1 Mfa1 family fimbria major subunit [Bacteroidales bacterium]